MIKISYNNMPAGSNKIKFFLRFYFNVLRTWYLFNIKYPWVQNDGFVRVMPLGLFVKRDIKIGNNVQFGRGTWVSIDVHFGNNILIASRVNFVGRNDHIFDEPCRTIWNSPRGTDDLTIVNDDVWIGTSSTILAGVTIGQGAIIAAGSLLTRSVPPCEIWGGVPAKKIRDRFKNEVDAKLHLQFLAAKK